MIRIYTLNKNVKIVLVNKINVKKILASLCFLLVFIVFQGNNANGQNAAGYVRNTASIGGSRFMTGIVTHPISGERYCRTDVGSAYRWDAISNMRIQLLDYLDESENGFYGVESIALDPKNPNNIYMLCGISYSNSGIESTDKENIFTYTDVTSEFIAHGNGNGERFALDSNNSNILLCGIRANGLWKSTDAGVTRNQIWTGATTTTTTTTTANGNGFCFVLYDPSGNVVSQTLYIGVSRSNGGNIYKSADGGAGFTGNCT